MASLRTERQMATVAALSTALRERFHEDLPPRGIYRDFTFEQAQSAIEDLVAMLAAHEAQATRPVDPVVPQHSDDQLDVAFPEVPMHVGTP